MRLFISTVAAFGLCVCVLLAACSPQDGSAPPAAAGSSNKSAPATSGGTPATSGGTPATSGSTTAQTTKSTPAPHADDTRRITIEETQAAINSGNALVVDVREESTYKVSHIKGAKSIPLPQFEKRLGELPPGKLIITYCA